MRRLAKAGNFRPGLGESERVRGWGVALFYEKYF